MPQQPKEQRGSPGAPPVHFRCPRCSYDLRDRVLPTTCSECGLLLTEQLAAHLLAWETCPSDTFRSVGRVARQLLCCPQRTFHALALRRDYALFRATELVGIWLLAHTMVIYGCALGRRWLGELAYYWEYGYWGCYAPFLPSVFGLRCFVEESGAWVWVVLWGLSSGVIALSVGRRWRLLSFRSVFAILGALSLLCTCLSCIFRMLAWPIPVSTRYPVPYLQAVPYLQTCGAVALLGLFAYHLFLLVSYTYRVDRDAKTTKHNPGSGAGR